MHWSGWIEWDVVVDKTSDAPLEPRHVKIDKEADLAGEPFQVGPELKGEQRFKAFHRLAQNHDLSLHEKAAPIRNAKPFAAVECRYGPMRPGIKGRWPFRSMPRVERWTGSGLRAMAGSAGTMSRGDDPGAANPAASTPNRDLVPNQTPSTSAFAPSPPGLRVRAGPTRPRGGRDA